LCTGCFERLSFLKNKKILKNFLKIGKIKSYLLNFIFLLSEKAALNAAFSENGIGIEFAERQMVLFFETSGRF
jgi:hypothetical protein